jgi:hypothetical protein
MEAKKWPFSIVLARIIDLIQAVICIAIIGLMTAIAIPNIAMGKPATNILPMVFLLGVCLVFGVIFLWLFINLGRLNPAARRVQIFVSIIGLFSFPIGTIFHGIILYGMFRQDTKEAFGIIPPAPK